MRYVCSVQIVHFFLPVSAKNLKSVAKTFLYAVVAVFLSRGQIMSRHGQIDFLIEASKKSLRQAQFVYFLKDGQRVPCPPRGWPPRYRPKFYPA